MSQLDKAAALRYTTSYMESHTISLIILISCGNYLSNLNVQVDFGRKGPIAMPIAIANHSSDPQPPSSPSKSHSGHR